MTLIFISFGIIIGHLLTMVALIAYHIEKTKGIEIDVEINPKWR